MKNKFLKTILLSTQLVVCSFAYSTILRHKGFSMPFNYLKAAFVGMILTTSGITSAAVIKFGNLTLENAADIYVTDTVNNVDYMRWDQDFNLTLAEITTATLETGSALHGWYVASSLQANNFTDALFADSIGGSQCYDTGNKLCGVLDAASVVAIVALMGGEFYPW